MKPLVLMGSVGVGVGAVGRPEGTGMILSGTQREERAVIGFSQLATSTAESSQAGGTGRMVQGHFRSVWTRDVAVRRGPGLGERHSVGQLRNGRQAEQCWNRG